jgi:hypothetical protein
MIDERKVRLRSDTPAGLYRVEAGILNLATGQRVPFTGPNGDRVTVVDIGEFRVLPDNVMTDGGFSNSTIGKIVFGDSIVLDQGLVSGHLQPETDLALDLRWSAQRSVSVNYTLFIHLTDSSGQIVAQLDHPLGGTTFPTSAWLTGDVFFDRESVRIPANLRPGSYELRVGLYDLRTMQRLPVTADIGSAGADYVLVATLNN